MMTRLAFVTAAAALHRRRDAPESRHGHPPAVMGSVPHFVAVGALTGPEGVLLVHRRADRAASPDCWDFPGGHIEPGDDAASALARELREEIGVLVDITGEPDLRIERRPTEEDGLMLDLWVIRHWIDRPTNVAEEEHDDLRWITAEAMSALRLAHPEYIPLLHNLLLHHP